jgi:hypothetical protein
MKVEISAEMPHSLCFEIEFEFDVELELISIIDIVPVRAKVSESQISRIETAETASKHREFCCWLNKIRRDVGARHR